MHALFQSVNDADLIRLIDEYPLAWVLPQADSDGLTAVPLPLLAEQDEEGRLISLFGHLARGTAHARALEQNPLATILFCGPQGYLSPGLVDEPSWAPTWNYAVVRFRCRIDFVADENDAALRRLTAKMEREAGGNWTVENIGERYNAMKTRIIAFRAEILGRRATFKLGQDERAEDFARIIERIGDDRMGEWMQRFRSEPD